MARKREEEAKGGLPAWMATYGDMVTLLLCFFVLLFSMSSVDIRKFKETIASFKEQIDILPGGEALTEGERINNGVSQMTEIEILIKKSLPRADEDSTSEEDEKGQPSEKDLTVEEAEKIAMEKAEEVAEQVHEYLLDEGVREDVDLHYSLNFVKITLPGEALFDSGQAVIKPEAYEILDVLGTMVQQDDFIDYDVQVEGHTDNVPINTIYFPSNWELSSARAIAVGTYLIDNLAYSEDKIACTGYGEFRPIETNETFEGRAQNRRVEVKIVLQTEEIDVQEFEEISNPNLESENDSSGDTDTESEPETDSEVNTENT